MSGLFGGEELGGRAHRGGALEPVIEAWQVGAAEELLLIGLAHPQTSLLEHQQHRLGFSLRLAFSICVSCTP